MVKPSASHVNDVKKGVESGRCITIGMSQKKGINNGKEIMRNQIKIVKK